MKKILFVVAALFLMLDMSAKSDASNKVQILRELSKDMEKEMKCDAGVVRKDRTAEIAFVTVKCPDEWADDMSFPMSNVSVYMDKFANIEFNPNWFFTDVYVFAEYTCHVSDELSYTMYMMYMKGTNSILIIM